LQSDFAAPGEGGDAIGGAESQRFDSHSGLTAARGDQAAAVAEKKIFDIVGAVVGIDDRGLGIVAHAAGTKKVEGEVVFFDGIVPFLLRTSCVEKFEGAVLLPRGELEIVGMVFVSHAQGRQAPSILEFRIERETVGFERKRGAVATNAHGAREVVADSILEALAPARRIWRKAA